MDPFEELHAKVTRRPSAGSLANVLVLFALVATPASPSADGVLLHPLCLDNLSLHVFDDGGGTDQVLICDTYPEIEIEGTPETWIHATRPSDDEGYYAGWIGYRVTGRFPELWEDGTFYLLEVATNTGGTGVFSSLWVLEQLAERPTFWPWLNIPGGDRCIDGQLRGLELSADTLVYAHAATPFRLLNPTDRTDWRWRHLARASGDTDDASPSTFMSWRPFDDVANCANCCVGEVVKELNLNTGDTRVTGVYVERSQWSTMFRPDDWLKDCTNEWLNGLAIPGSKDEAVYVPLDAWFTMLDDLGQQCADAEHRAKLERDLREWLAAVTSRLQRHWRQPPRLDASNRATVFVRVNQAGHVNRFEIESCSGRPSFCASVENAMHSLTLLPPPPDVDAVKDGVRVHFKPD